MMKRAWVFSLVMLVGGVVLGLRGGLVGCRAARPTAAPLKSWRAAPTPLKRPVQGIWVARFHYHYPEDIRTIMRNCAAVGCNTVYWQVRGEGTVAYRSELEPWSREYRFADPGFDPLALAVEEAHRHGLRIEAWVNVMPGWKGPEPPPTERQLYNAHPEWFIANRHNQRQPLYTVDRKTGRKNSFYLILNPCWPEVRAHIAAVMGEIVSRYDVDGLHLDYVRYAWDGTANAKREYPRDQRTVALYWQETGRRPDDDPAAWDHWRANQLTRLVVQVRQVVDRYRPGASLTAAVWGNPVRGYNDYLQNSVAWLRSGLIDAALPMAYTDKVGQLRADIDAYRLAAEGALVVPGLGVYKHETHEQLADQLQQCEFWGGDVGLFSYESLFPVAGDRRRAAAARDQAQRLRLMRRQVVEQFLRQ